MKLSCRAFSSNIGRYHCCRQRAHLPELRQRTPSGSQSPATSETDASSPSHPTSAHTQIHARRCSVRPSSSAHYSTSFSLFLEPARVPASAESALDVPDAPRTSGCALQITSMVPTARSVLCSQNGQGHSADYATHKAFSCPGGHIDPEHITVMSIVLKLSLSDAAVYPRLTIQYSPQQRGLDCTARYTLAPSPDHIRHARRVNDLACRGAPVGDPVCRSDWRPVNVENNPAAVSAKIRHRGPASDHSACDARGGIFCRRRSRG